MIGLLPPLVDVAIRACLVLAAAAVATRLLRRSAASGRHLVWALAVTGVLALPAIMAALPAWRVLPQIHLDSADRSAEALRHMEAPPGTGAVATPVVTGAGGQPSNASPAFTVPQRFGGAILTLWSVVALLLLARIAWGIHAVRRLARHGRPADERWRARLRQLSPELSGRIRLLVSRDIAMPMTWGSRRPLLLLPAGAADWSDERATVVLLHELAHIHRADWITHAIARVAAALHWFNPLAWTALRAMTRERERACDDYVLAHGARASDYAQHLLDIARAGVSGAAFAVAPAMGRPSELEGRLLSILAPRPRTAGGALRPMVPLVAVMATGMIAAAAPAVAPDPPAPPPQAAQPRASTRTNALLGDPPKARDESAEAATVKALTRALEDSSASVRESAALGLAFRSGPGVVEPLLRALKDESSQVREKAAIGLAMRQQPRVVDALLEAVHDKDSQVREKVVIALGLSGDARAHAALMAALDDPDEQVREKAVKALTTFPLSDAIRDGITGALESFRSRVP